MHKKSELQQYVTKAINDLSSQPGFPTDYCNVASKHLFDVLKQSGEKNIRLQHSYREPGDGHTYLIINENGKDIILDPTYAQYDSEYKDGFVGEHFPDKTLEENRMEQKDFMKKQKEWFDDGVYDNL